MNSTRHDENTGRDHYFAMNSQKNLKDCPKCKHGSILQRRDAKWHCIDCQWVFTAEDLVKSGKRP